MTLARSEVSNPWNQNVTVDLHMYNVLAVLSMADMVCLACT